MIAGLLLAGGRSSRFGSEKALAGLGGVSLLEHGLATLQAGCGLVAISADPASGAAALARDRGLAVLEDPPGLAKGPLAGVLAGLRWAAAQGADRLATAPCDTPFLPADLVVRLDAALGQDDGAAAARASDGLHPLCGVWRTRLAEPLAARLAQGHPPVRAIIETLGGRIVDFPDPAAFVNVNTRQDLSRAETEGPKS